MSILPSFFYSRHMSVSSPTHGAVDSLCDSPASLCDSPNTVGVTQYILRVDYSTCLVPQLGNTQLLREDAVINVRVEPYALRLTASVRAPCGSGRRQVHRELPGGGGQTGGQPPGGDDAGAHQEAGRGGHAEASRMASGVGQPLWRAHRGSVGGGRRREADEGQL
eukprot:9478340-Pyramimonas_sp.AAC.4